MKLKNVSNKIVHVGQTAIMIGEEKEFDISYSKLPGIRAMIKRGTLVMDDTQERVAAEVARITAVREEAMRIARAEAEAEQARKAAQTAEPAPEQKADVPAAEPVEAPKTTTVGRKKKADAPTEGK